jgi:hypothetical protein
MWIKFFHLPFILIYFLLYGEEQTTYDRYKNTKEEEKN